MKAIFGALIFLFVGMLVAVASIGSFVNGDNDATENAVNDSTTIPQEDGEPESVATNRRLSDPQIYALLQGVWTGYIERDGIRLLMKFRFEEDRWILLGTGRAMFIEADYAIAGSFKYFTSGTWRIQDGKMTFKQDEFLTRDFDVSQSFPKGLTHRGPIDKFFEKKVKAYLQIFGWLENFSLDGEDYLSHRELLVMDEQYRGQIALVPYQIETGGPDIRRTYLLSKTEQLDQEMAFSRPTSPQRPAPIL